MVDAFAEQVGAALQQRATRAPPWEPLGFFSRKLDAAKARYSAYDRELLAFRHFRFAFHSMAHPGAKATRRIMNQRVVWSCIM
jgi:hypothetical protein